MLGEAYGPSRKSQSSFSSSSFQLKAEDGRTCCSLSSNCPLHCWKVHLVGILGLKFINQWMELIILGIEYELTLNVMCHDFFLSFNDQFRGGG